jgi:hypothetical protein
VLLLEYAGAVLSNLIGFDVTFVVLQFHAASHTFGVTLHVAVADSVLIVHVTGVHDTIHTASVYVNVELWFPLYRFVVYVLLLEYAGAVLSIHPIAGVEFK